MTVLSYSRGGGGSRGRRGRGGRGGKGTTWRRSINTTMPTASSNQTSATIPSAPSSVVDAGDPIATEASAPFHASFPVKGNTRRTATSHSWKRPRASKASSVSSQKKEGSSTIPRSSMSPASESATADHANTNAFINNSTDRGEPQENVALGKHSSNHTNEAGVENTMNTTMKEENITKEPTVSTTTETTELTGDAPVASSLPAATASLPKHKTILKGPPPRNSWKRKSAVKAAKIVSSREAPDISFVPNMSAATKNSSDRGKPQENAALDSVNTKVTGGTAVASSRPTAAASPPKHKPILKGPPPRNSWKRKSPVKGVQNESGNEVPDICLVPSLAEQQRLHTWKRPHAKQTDTETSNAMLGDHDDGKNTNRKAHVGTVSHSWKRTNHSNDDTSGAAREATTEEVPSMKPHRQFGRLSVTSQRDRFGVGQGPKRIKLGQHPGKTTDNSAAQGTSTVDSAVELTEFAYSSRYRPTKGQFHPRNSRRQHKANQLVRVNPSSTSRICTQFLRGLTCDNPACRDRHDVPQHHAMPVCAFFVRHRGMCLNPDCRFRHVKVDPRAEMCPQFLAVGFCQDEDCLMQHVRPAKKASSYSRKSS